MATSNPLYYYNNVLSTFLHNFGNAAGSTVTFSGLKPDQLYEFQIIAHDTSTNNAHKHHVGSKSQWTVTGKTTQQKTLTQSNKGNSVVSLQQLDSWNNILVTAPENGQVSIKFTNGRLTAILFRQR